MNCSPPTTVFIWACLCIWVWGGVVGGKIIQFVRSSLFYKSFFLLLLGLFGVISSVKAGDIGVAKLGETKSEKFVVDKTKINSENANLTITAAVTSLTATITTTATSVCQNGTATVTLTGIGGNPIYGFKYNINGAPDVSTLSTAGSSASIPVQTGTPGTFVYNLTEVSDNGGGSNHTAVAYSVTITVNPSPTIVIHQPNPVCFPNTVDLTDGNIINGSSGYALSNLYEEITAVTLIPLVNASAISVSGPYFIKLTSAAGCSAISQVNATINAIPTITTQPISAAQVICVNGAANTLSITGTAGSGTISSVQWYSNVITDNTTGTLVATHTAPGGSDSFTPSTAIANPAGAFFYAVITNSNGCTIASDFTGMGSLIINPLPTFNPIIPPLPIVCQGTTSFPVNYSTTFSPDVYSIIWSAAAITAGFTNVTDAALGTSPGTFNVSVPSGAAAGLYAGSLSVKITSTGCFSAFTPASLSINPLPTATISGTTSVCQNALQPNITLTGSGGTLPYTFTYNINGGANQTIATTGGSSSVTIPVSTATVGAFVFSLVSVQESSITACSNSATGSATVSVNALPTATITPLGVTTFCAGGTLSLTASAGVSWLWNTGETTQTISAAASGNYSVTVTNASGCSATSAFTTVTVNPLPTASITAGGPTSFCFGGSVNLTGFGGVSYVWSNGLTATTINVASSGTFTVTAIDVNGCAAISAITTVTVIPLPPANITPSGSTTFCTGGSVNLTASVGSSWLWSDGSTSQMINTASSGVFTVTVTNAGCSATSTSTTVTVNPLPSATITAGGATTFCAGGTVNLTASAGTSYLWSTGATTPTIAVTNSGSYSVTVTNGSGCSATSTSTTVTVNALPTATITAGGATTFCSGGTVNLTASAGTSYLWSTGATTQTIAVTNSGSYSVTVTNGSGCSATSTSTNVTVNTLPIATIVTSGATTFCNGGSVNLTASAGTSYLWSTGATTPTIAVTNSGSYSVTVTNGSGCSATSTSTTVTVNALPTATITAGSATTFCSGGTVNLTASAGTSYLWSTGATTPTIAVTNSGSYSVTVTNGSGCSATSTSTTVTVNALPTATITAGGATTFCAGGTVNLTASAGTSYLWSTGAITQTIAVTNSGSYSVTVTNGSGCSATSTSTTVTVNALPTATITAGGATTFCAGGTVNLTASAGTSYLWSNGATTQTIAVSNSGSFSVTVSNASGCSATSALTTVTANPLPTATISASGATTFCSGGSVNLTAGVGTSWLWNTGATTQTININNSGNYSVTIFNANGCSSVSSIVQVVVNPLPQVTISASGPTTFCSGGSVNLSASSGSSWLWNTGEATQTITVTSSANQSVIVTDVNGCSSSSSILPVIVNPSPSHTISSSGPTSFCAGGSVNLSASAGTSWIWNTGETTQTITVNSSGNRSVTVTNANGCSTNSVIVPVTVFALPVANINTNGPVTFCAGGSVTLSASPGSSWLWNTGETTQSVTINSSAVKTVSVINSNGCSATSAATVVTVKPLPNAFILPGGNTSICIGDTLNLTASAGNTCLWNTGATTPTIIVKKAGNYSVTITSLAGCSATSAPLPVIVNALPTATITASGPTTFCSNQTLTLSAGNANKYQWSSGETTQNVTIIKSGTYTVTVTDVNGCSATTVPIPVTVLTAPSVAVSITGTVNFCSGSSVLLTAGAGSSWVWTNGANTQSILIKTSGTYSAVITASNGCSVTTSPTIVTVNALPNLNITNPAAVCLPSGADLTSNNITSGSSNNLTYTYWKDAIATNSLPNPNYVTTSGTYFIKATNAVNCSVTQPVIVTANAAPVLVINHPAVCNPAKVDLTSSSFVSGSSSGLSYSYWRDTTALTPLSNATTVSTAGKYYIKGTSVATGCSVVKPVVVSFNALPNFTVTNPAAICAPGQVNLLATGIVTGLPVNVSISYWKDEATTQSLLNPNTVATSGTYFIKATTVAGCTSVKPVNVSIQTQPTVNITDPAAVCIPGTVNLLSSSITAGSSIGTVFSYWKDAAATIALNSPASINASGTYYIKGSLASGCNDIKPVTVSILSVPNINITNPASVCEPATIDLTTPSITKGSSAGALFSYYIDSTLTTTLINPASVNVSGKYYIKASLLNSCSASLPVTVIVNTLPVGSIQTPSANYICEGASVVLQASSNAFGYQWLYNQTVIPRATGASYAATKPGIYSLQLASQNGCSNAAGNSIQLDMVNKPSLAFTATNFCLGSQTSFVNNSGFANSGGIGWVWNFGDGSSVNNFTAQHTYAAPGTYNVSLTAVNASCPNLSTQKIIPVTIEKAAAGVRYDTIKTFSGISSVITARSFGVKYNWQPAFGLNSSFTRTPIVTLISDNEYTVNIQSAAGCITTDTVYVKVIGNGDIYVPQGFTPNNDGLNDRAFPILVGIKQLTYFKIFNRWGNLVFQTNDASPQNGWDGKLHGVLQTSGTFRWTAEGVDVGGNIIRRSGEIRMIN